MNELGKTIEEWEAIEQAERKTLLGKIKHGYFDYVYYPLYRRWYSISRIPTEIKWFIQRGKRGYSDCDVWAIDSYLNDWIPDAIHQLRKNTISYPDKTITLKKWKQILKQIELGFRASKKIECAEFKSDAEFKKLERYKRRGLKLFIKWYDALWD